MGRLAAVRVEEEGGREGEERGKGKKRKNMKGDHELQVVSPSLHTATVQPHKYAAGEQIHRATGAAPC